MSKVIEKKVLSKYFDKIVSGEKTYELRLADWDCQQGDTLVLNEIDPKTKQPTGRSLKRRVGYIGKTKDFDFWTKEEVDKYGYQIISLLEDEDKPNEKFKLIPAVYLLLRRKDEVLLLQRANTGYQDGKYSLIAGHVDGDELATNEIKREAKEEAGITIDPNKLKFVHVAHRLNRNQVRQERIDLFYELWDWEGEIVNAEPSKCDDLSWHPINNLPESTLPFIRLVLTDITKGIYYSEYTEEPK
jgi:8-oxo-dGTP diphosphatase